MERLDEAQMVLVDMKIALWFKNKGLPRPIIPKESNAGCCYFSRHHLDANDTDGIKKNYLVNP